MTWVTFQRTYHPGDPRAVVLIQKNADGCTRAITEAAYARELEEAAK